MADLRNGRSSQTLLVVCTFNKFSPFSFLKFYVALFLHYLFDKSCHLSYPFLGSVSTKPHAVKCVSCSSPQYLESVQIIKIRGYWLYIESTQGAEIWILSDEKLHHILIRPLRAILSATWTNHSAVFNHVGWIYRGTDISVRLFNVSRKRTVSGCPLISKDWWSFVTWSLFSSLIGGICGSGGTFKIRVDLLDYNRQSLITWLLGRLKH